MLGCDRVPLLLEYLLPCVDPSSVHYRLKVFIRLLLILSVGQLGCPPILLFGLKLLEMPLFFLLDLLSLPPRIADNFRH